MKPFWDDRVIGWVARKAGDAIPGGDRGFGPATGMGVLNSKGTLVAGAVFHNWNPEAGLIEMSVVILDPRAWCRSVMREAFGYAFDQLKCQMIIARTDPTNDRALKCWRALGADEYEIKRGRGRGKSEIVSTLTDDAWACALEKMRDRVKARLLEKGQDNGQQVGTEAA